MITFLGTVDFVRDHYPIIWDNHPKRDRRILVRYWLPGVQLDIPLVWNA